MYGWVQLSSWHSLSVCLAPEQAPIVLIISPKFTIFGEAPTSSTMTVDMDLPISIHLSSLPAGPRRMNTKRDGMGHSVISPMFLASDKRMKAAIWYFRHGSSPTITLHACESGGTFLIKSTFSCKIKLWKCLKRVLQSSSVVWMIQTPKTPCSRCNVFMKYFRVPVVEKN